jgi:hypothetical protein
MYDSRCFIATDAPFDISVTLYFKIPLSLLRSVKFATSILHDSDFLHMSYKCPIKFLTCNAKLL